MNLKVRGHRKKGHSMVKKDNVLVENKDANNVIPSDYRQILEGLRSKIRAAQLKALATVNKELITVYREIGKTIHDQQKEGSWGASIVEQLAKDLQNSFPGMRGFSACNLWNMRDFHLSYEKNEKLQALTAEISWTQEKPLFTNCFLQSCVDIIIKTHALEFSLRGKFSM